MRHKRPRTHFRALPRTASILGEVLGEVGQGAVVAHLASSDSCVKYRIPT